MQSTPILLRNSKMKNAQNIVPDKLFGIFFFSDLHAIRFVLGIAELIWALTLFWPGDTFVRPTYHAMAEIMSEPQWAFVFLFSGITQIAILFHGEYHTTFPRVYAAWNAFLWCFICVAMYMSVYPPPAAISGETALALGSCWIFLRTGYHVVGRRISDHGRS